MDKIAGGCVLPISDFWMGSGIFAHTSEQQGRPVSQADLDATNTLSATSWRINRRVLDVAKVAWDLGHPCMEIDRLVEPLVPERMSQNVFTSLCKEEKAAVSSARYDAILALKGWRSTVKATTSVIEIAEDDADLERFWFMWGHDARLRRYPRSSSGPNPQGSGLSRALLEFAEGKPLGHRGLWWLAVRAATAAGLDKKDHNERAEWADKNTEIIRATAREPFATDWWWKDRDDPWALLATCFEINDALSCDDPSAFRSHLPVQVDGTCNGLQHLAALGLDRRGAASVNLCATPDRQDIYAEVGASVNERLGRDLAETYGPSLASLWVGLVDRQRVKRGVMTTNYGVTPRGMRDQLLETKEHVPGDNKAIKMAAVNYLRDQMWDAIGEVAHNAREIMAWLQHVAETLGGFNMPFCWDTPMGTTIQQSYRPVTVVRPLTAMGQVVVSSKVDRTSIKARKGALAAAPNFVHSMDAAHMALTILGCARQGVTHFSMIHDSYGTHAADMDIMARVLREEFVAIYRDDWLMKAWETADQMCPEEGAIRKPPARGEFDVTQVLRSPWFFA